MSPLEYAHHSAATRLKLIRGFVLAGGKMLRFDRRTAGNGLGRRYSVVVLAALVGIVGMLTSCGSRQESTPAEQGTQTLKIGTTGDFAPMEYRDKDGNVIGYVADMVTSVMDHLGYKVEWVQLQFAGMIPALSSGRVDMITTIYDTPERRKAVTFVDYGSEQNAVIARSDEVKEIKTWLDLCGQSVGTLVGAPSLLAAIRRGSQECTDAGKPTVELKTYQSTAQEIQDLTGSRLKAGIDGGSTFGYAAKQSNGAVSVAFLDGDKTPLGWALAKGSPLLDKMTDGLAAFLKSDQPGQLSEKYGLPTGLFMDKPEVFR